MLLKDCLQRRYYKMGKILMMMDKKLNNNKRKN